MKKRLIYPGEPKIPLAQAQPQTDKCAHTWVRTEIHGRKALKCQQCGKIIDSQD